MRLLLVFSVAPFKIDQNKNQNRLIDYLGPESEEKKECKYVKTLPKIQVTAIFLLQDKRRNVLPKLI